VLAISTPREISSAENRFVKLNAPTVITPHCNLVEKWKELKTKQNKTKDNNMQSGRSHKTTGVEVVEQCIDDKASVKPIFTFATVRPQVLVHIHSKQLMRVLILKMIQWIPRMSKVKQLLTQN